VNSVPTAVACLLVAALIAAWPAGDRRARQARVLTSASADPAARTASVRSVLAHVEASPGRATLVAGAAAAAAAAAVGGPVAAIAAGTYGTLATHGWLQRRRHRLAAWHRSRRLDELSGLAADLRAGLPPPVAVGFENGAGDGGVDRLTELTNSARRLAEETGAPLADLLDRIEADARAADRAQVAAKAQAAGARVTAALLAALPAAGIGLGYAMGGDPMAVLLRTPLGAGCAVTAIVLQIAGLAWSQRLVRIGP
jgi:tight adherence protein B